MSLTKYIEKKQTDCFKKHGVIFAFSNKQFEEQKQNNVTYVSLGGGTLCPKNNVKKFIEDHSDIIKAGIAQDIKENGKANIIERELANYECYYTGDIENCVEALEDYGFTHEDVLEVYRETRENHEG